MKSKTKATILLENTWGFPVIRHVWLKSYELKKENWGFQKSLHVYFTYKGKRKGSGLKLKKAVIAEGWQEISGAMNTENNSDFTCFDAEKFEEIKAGMSKILIQTPNCNG